jgi:S1-C subfamily serine protease
MFQSVLSKVKRVTGLDGLGIALAVVDAAGIVTAAFLAPGIAGTMLLGALGAAGAEAIVATLGHRQLGATQVVQALVVGTILGVLPSLGGATFLRAATASYGMGFVTGALTTAESFPRNDVPSLGITVTDTGQGVAVETVTRGSRAARIGLTPGDVIQGLNAVGTRTRDELDGASSTAQGGLALNIERGDHLLQLDEPGAKAHSLGIKYLPVPFVLGLVVREIYTGGTADRAGVRAGDRIVALSGQDVWNEESLRHALGLPGDSVTFSVLRDGRGRSSMT